MSELKIEDLVKRLGRLPSQDIRDRNFPMLSFLPARNTVNINHRYWWSNGLWGNQGNTSQCVAYAWIHWKEDGPITQNKLAFKFTPTELYNKCQQVDEWPGQCVDVETQAYTKNGWKFYHELKVGEEIYTFNIDKQEAEWCKLEKVNVFQNRKVTRFHNSTADIRTTSNHKWLVTDRNFNNERYLVETTELKSKHAVPISAPSASVPRIKSYEDHFVRLVAWVITEGHLRKTKRKQHGIAISQKKYKTELKSVLESNGILVGYEKPDGCFVSEFGKEFTESVFEVVDYDKNVDFEFIRKLTQFQLEEFIEHCIMADGSIVSAIGNRKERRLFYQKKGNGNVLEAFEMACILAGKSIRREKIAKKYFNETNGSEEEMCKVSLIDSNFVAIRKMEQETLEEQTVWCPTSQNLTFLAKRNGFIFYTGNSYDGTSVRAGAKILLDAGFIESYRWTTNVHEIATAIITTGPVVVGTNWYYDMFTPDPKTGIIKVANHSMGGHAYKIDGVNVKSGIFRIKNSWGREWGKNGFAYINFQDMQRLLDEQGEACLAIELKKAV